MLFLLSLPLTFFYVRLVFSYFDYYDIGVNNFANSGWLTYVVAPSMFVIFNVGGFATQWLAKRRGMKPRQTFGIAALVMIAVFIAAFLLEFITNLDYPSPKTYDLFEFLGHLIGAGE